MKVDWKEIKASNCTEKGGVWNCLWTNSILSGAQSSSIKVSILSKSEDDAGNSVDLDNSVLSETFVVDNQNPILVGEIEITNLNNRTYVQDEIVSGDVLHIKAVLKDKTPVTASADLSSLGLGEDEKVTCTQNGTRWICEWTTSAISPKAVNNILKFKFTDLVGNEAKKDINVKILGISVEENPNYWKVSNIGKMPLAIDRQTTELINHKTYYHIKLKPVDIYDSPIILALDLNCMGDIDYIDDYELINEKSDNPYIILTLKQGTMPNTSLSFNCSLLIVSRVRDVIIQNAEEEPVDVTIDFYNLPLGELGENVKDKIKDAQDGWLVRQEWITTVEHWLDIAETICNLLNTWGKVNQVLDDAAILFGDYPFAQTLRGFYQTSHDAHDFIVQHKYNLCKYISCDKTIWGGWYDEFSSQNTPEIFKEMGFGNTFWPSTPRDSIVLSIATGCLPGIIHNLQKMRQIECYYVLCLKKAADEGIPLSVCDEQKAYLECTFIYGEIFQIIPFGGFFKGLAGQFNMIVSDPIGMIFGGLNFYCKMQPTLKTYAVCSLGHLIPTLGSIVGDIQMYFDTDTWSLSGDVCEEAMKPLPEPEDEEDTEETDGEGGDQTTEDE